MDDGCKAGSGLKISTNNFTEKEVLSLCHCLNKLYKLNTSIQSAGTRKMLDGFTKIKSEQFVVYISKNSMELLKEIVMPYIHPSMKYKLLTN